MSEPRILLAEAPGAPLVARLPDPPDLAPGAALVTVIGVALDGWDVRLLDGAMPDTAWPIVPGRFFVGAIERLGVGLAADATGQRLRPGTPVLVPSVIPCGDCALCRHPPLHAHGCLAPRRLGVDPGIALSGGLAEAVLLPRGAIHALPLTMPLFLATLGERLANCLRALGRAQAIGRFPIGGSVVVFGQDVTALLAVVAARELGAGTIAVVGGPDAPFLRLARGCSAEATIDVTDVPEPEARVAITRETVGGRGADLVLTTGGMSREGLACLREGGAMVAMGTGGGDGAELITERDLTVLGVTGCDPADIPVALAMLFRVHGRYPFAAMQPRFPASVAGVAEALGAIRSGATPGALIPHRPDLIG